MQSQDDPAVAALADMDAPTEADVAVDVFAAAPQDVEAGEAVVDDEDEPLDESVDEEELVAADAGEIAPETPVRAFVGGSEINAVFKRFEGESAKHGRLCVVKSEHNGGLYTVPLSNLKIKKLRVNRPRKVKPPADRARSLKRS